MMEHPLVFLEKALAYADQNGIDYDICHPQLDCVINNILPLMRQGRVFGYIRMTPKGEMLFEYADKQQQAARLLKAA